MFKPYKGMCFKCGWTTIIVVKSGLCTKCNHKNKKSNKSKRIVKFLISQYKRKATGEKQIFEEIAGEREWICFVTGQPLIGLTATSFMHVLPKALNKYPKFKLNKSNIVLAADNIHFRFDHTPRTDLKEDYWQKLFDLEKQLKQQYYEQYGKR